jgi:ERCC4-type nuclease
MPKKPSSKMVIAVDTREQKPYGFTGSVKKTLSAGDYSIVGHESRVSVERKQVCELCGIVGKGRERFERELTKLSEYEYAAIVIEGRLFDVLQPNPFSNVPPRAVINSLVSWSIRFGVHVFFADSRRYGMAITHRILERFYTHKAVGEGQEVCDKPATGKTPGKNTRQKS